MKGGLARGHFPKVHVHSGELPLTRESPQSGWLPTEIREEVNSGDGPSLLKVPVKS